MHQHHPCIMQISNMLNNERRKPKTHLIFNSQTHPQSNSRVRTPARYNQRFVVSVGHHVEPNSGDDEE